MFMDRYLKQKEEKNSLVCIHFIFYSILDASSYSILSRDLVIVCVNTRMHFRISVE